MNEINGLLTLLDLELSKVSFTDQVSRTDLATAIIDLIGSK